MALASSLVSKHAPLRYSAVCRAYDVVDKALVVALPVLDNMVDKLANELLHRMVKTSVEESGKNTVIWMSG